MTEPQVRVPWLTRSKLLVVVGVVAVFCVLGLIGFLRRPAAARPAEPVVGDLPQDRPSPIADSLEPPRPKHDLPPPSKQTGKPIPEDQRARSSADYDPKDTSTDWAVIAATLNARQAAERRAQSLKTQWSECACKVYPPAGESPKYFVVLGTGLGRNQADRLRDQATAAGLPADTYVTKLISE